MSIPGFDATRLRAYQLLTDAQELLLEAPGDQTVTQSRAVRDVLSYLAAAKQALVGAAPLVTDCHAGLRVRDL